MGWFDEAISNVGQAVSATVQGAGQILQGVGGAVTDTFQGGGIEAIGAKAANRFNQVAGAAGTVVTGGLLETDAVKHIGRDRGWNTYTLGLSGDISGAGQAFKSGRNMQNINPEDVQGIFRAGGKLIGAAYGAAAYDEYQAASSIGGSSLDSFWAGAGQYGEYASYLGLGATGVKYASDLANGKAGDVVKDATGIPADWLNTNQPVTGPRGPSPIGVPAPRVQNPWDFSRSADSGLSAGSGAGVSPVVILGVGLLAYLAYRRFK